MRLIFPILGIVVAAIFGNSADRGFDILAGAFIGFLLADLNHLRVQLKGLSDALAEFAAELHRRRSASEAKPAAPPAAAPNTEVV